LVESYYFKNALINYFVDSNNIADEITLLANGKNISNISGQGSENKKEIINKLGIDKLNLRQKDLSDFEVEILSKKDEVIDVRNYYR
ncbi:radical SAM protein, partial [Peptoniphilus genitalis]